MQLEIKYIFLPFNPSNITIVHAVFAWLYPNVQIFLLRIPKLGAVPTVLTLVVVFSSHNVQALPQFGVFPGKTSYQTDIYNFNYRNIWGCHCSSILLLFIVVKVAPGRRLVFH